MLSGPGDLVSLSFFSLSRTISVVILISSKQKEVTGSIIGKFFVSSETKVEEKKLFNSMAISLSSIRISVFAFIGPIFVDFCLLEAYEKKYFGLDFRFEASFFSKLAFAFLIRDFSSFSIDLYVLRLASVLLTQ